MKRNTIHTDTYITHFLTKQYTADNVEFHANFILFMIPRGLGRIGQVLPHETRA
jgi:hypothetical protein